MPALTAESGRMWLEKGAVTVAVPSYWHPMFCVDIDDYHEGFVPDTLEKVTEFSGLEFRYVRCASYQGALLLVQEGRADMVGFFMGSDEEAAVCGLARTAVYTDISPILVRNKNVTYPSEGRVCGVLSGREKPSFVTAEEVVYYDTAEEGLADVNRGKIDFFYGIAAHLENIIREDSLFNVVQVSLPNYSAEISFAVPRPVASPLFSILNKAVNNLTDTEKEAISGLNMVSIGDTQLTLAGIVAANPMMVLAVASLFVLIALVSVIIYSHFRLNSARMRLELEEGRKQTAAPKVSSSRG